MREAVTRAHRPGQSRRELRSDARSPRLRQVSLPNSLPFSRKLVTTSVPDAFAKSDPAEEDGVPEQEEASQGKGEPLSAFCFTRFLFFLEDMTRGLPNRSSDETGLRCPPV